VLLAPGSSTTTNGTAYFNPTLTYVYTGYFYTGGGIQVAAGTSAVVVTSATVITVTTVNPHGLAKGSFAYIVGTTGGTNVNGAYVVATTPTANTFTVTAAAASGTVTTVAGQTNVYARPAGYVESRTFDGGVAFSAATAAPNSQLIRQTRRYFRYQSGKAIQFSTGTSLCPALFVTSLTSSTTTSTVTTRFAHNLTTNTTIIVTGADQAAYNGTFTVASVTSPTSFTYTTLTTPSAATATGINLKVSPINWYGSSNRIGMFDQQNGLFFEYDGQTLYAVWRNSVNQISGSVAVTQGQSAVTGTGTQFSSDLKPGDFIVIRGQTYRVDTIVSDTSIYLTTEYRGATLASGALVSKTIDTRIPRSQWADPLDGTGPSGYILDLTRMQMWYIDYSWYGAGFSRFGLRTAKGQISYVYQFTNNNQRYEAYMRSGNMAAHYESNSVNPITYITSTLSSATVAGGVINVADASLFAPSGTVKVNTASQTGAVEYITYTSKTATTLVIGARGQTGGSAATTFTYSATAPVSVEYFVPDTSASLSHWGSSVIMDGRFDDDKSLIFNYGTTTSIGTTSISPIVIMAIRLAPSVDNGTVGLLGRKEIINRAQLQLTELGLYTTGTGYLINLVLNGYASGAMSGGFVTPAVGTTAYTSSFAQIAINTNAVTVNGGESVAAAYTNATGQTVLDLSGVRDLGNSILGGGTTNTVTTSYAGVYPDGPDVLYVVATPLTTTSSTILARLSWKEAQA